MNKEPMLSHPGILILLALFLFTCRFAGAEGTFPIYSREKSFPEGKEDQTFAPWPFVETKKTTDTLTKAFHPFWSWYGEHVSGKRQVHVLWPLVSWNYTPETKKYTDKRTLTILPLFYGFSGTKKKTGLKEYRRMLFPFYYQGKREQQGRWFVLFPFFWYARDAVVNVPLFPDSPQTFAAMWPLFGRFHNWWNRDEVFFVLWPLFVKSWNDAEKKEDSYSITSVLWPIFSRVKGPETSGWRAWPLFADISKKNDFHRMYWLWPLGRYQKEYDEEGKPKSRLLWFLPFYADVHSPDLDYDMVFPLYGDLRMEGRRTRGWALAFYNRDENFRSGIAQHQLFWFLIRWRTRVPILEESPPNPDPVMGGGFFPIFTRKRNSVRETVKVLWPIVTYKWNRYDRYDFSRTYIVPFFSLQKKRYKDGSTDTERFFFPFFRKSNNREGDTKRSALHFFWYDWITEIDRNWAPVWTFYEREDDAQTGEKSIAWFKHAWTYKRTPEGAERKRVNLLFYHYESIKQPDEKKTGKSQVLWGLYGKHFGEDPKTEILWIKF